MSRVWSMLVSVEGGLGEELLTFCSETLNLKVNFKLKERILYEYERTTNIYKEIHHQENEWMCRCVCFLFGDGIC